MSEVSYCSIRFCIEITSTLTKENPLLTGQINAAYLPNNSAKKAI